MMAAKDSSPKKAADGRTLCIQRRRLLSAALTGQARLFLAIPLVFFNQGRAGAEDRREGQKQSTRRRAKSLGDEARADRRQSAQPEP
jgi:hypothetical protein